MAEEGTKEAEAIAEEELAIPFVEFLETVPPSQVTLVTDLVYFDKSTTRLSVPEVQLHCNDDVCNGNRFYRFSGSYRPSISKIGSWEFLYLTYVCSNCRRSRKTFSLAVRQIQNLDGEAYKFGELPVYGPQTSTKLIKLIGPDRELFLRGRRCESQGLGIGAFVYYRRVVENQKNRILDEVIKVSRKLAVDEENIKMLEAAKNETQFSKSVESVKDVLPQALLINGHNPLTLLHSALSKGLHEKDDAHCLELANSIRVVLGELSDRLSQALKDEAEINVALSKLLGV